MSRHYSILSGLIRFDCNKLLKFVVKVNSQDGWWWKSSQTRNDTGNGACEVVWVDEIEIK